MAVSLEAREPLLDHRLIEFAARVPAGMRLKGGSGKWLMKKALGRYLPDEILHRRKMGFVTPISAWFRGPLAEQASTIGRGSALSDWAGSMQRWRASAPTTVPAAPITAVCSGNADARQVASAAVRDRRLAAIRSVKYSRRPRIEPRAARSRA